MAVQARLDLLGMLVLAFVTALGGGIVRDLLIGDVPPSSIRNWNYAAVALSTGAAVFILHAYTSAMNQWLITSLDAAGLSFFAVAGATKALEFKLHPLLATMMGASQVLAGVRSVICSSARFPKYFARTSTRLPPFSVLRSPSCA